jgi:hypothetical protein
MMDPGGDLDATRAGPARGGDSGRSDGISSEDIAGTGLKG